MKYLKGLGYAFLISSVSMLITGITYFDRRNLDRERQEFERHIIENFSRQVKYVKIIPDINGDGFSDISLGDFLGNETIFETQEDNERLLLRILPINVSEELESVASGYNFASPK